MTSPPGTCVARVPASSPLEGGGDLGDDRPQAHDQHQYQRGRPRPRQGGHAGGQAGRPEQQVPDDRPGRGAAERPRRLQAGGDERVTANRMTSAGTVTAGQASAMIPTARARLPRTIRDVLSDLNMTGPFARCPGTAGVLDIRQART
ncbi:MAG: hypothetical protein ACLPN6_17700 [Streptosporangiaceae bacterium]